MATPNVGFEMEGKRYSHIIDPRTGRPVQHVVSVTVIADDGATADAVATICNVLGTEGSIKMVDGLPGVDCLIVREDGSRVASEGWPTRGKTDLMLVNTNTDEGKAAELQDTMLVEFEISRSEGGRRYRRPYVAVWIEDEDRFPVRTLSLFLMQNNPGPRWYRDLRRWYSDDQLRLVVDSKNMIETVSKPTRNPGKYKVAWDGWTTPVNR